MATQIFPQTTIAVIWDFDDTLTPGSMQAPIFKEYGIDGQTFWHEVNRLSEYYASINTKVNQSSAYLNHMLTYVQNGKFPGLDNTKLEELGDDITFFDGLPEFFDILKSQVLREEHFRKHGLTVELYVISTGLIRMIQGSKIAPHLDGIWGCEFIQDIAQPGYTDNEQVQLIPKKVELGQIGYLIDDTTKTRAIFEINKGVNRYPDVDVNAQIPLEHRRVPFTNMVYVADGPSDIPVFSSVKSFRWPYIRRF